RVAGDDDDRLTRIDLAQERVDELLDDIEDFARQLDPSRVTHEVGDLVLVEREVMGAGEPGENGGGLVGHAAGQGALAKKLAVKVVLPRGGPAAGERPPAAGVVPGAPPDPGRPRRAGE